MIYNYKRKYHKDELNLYLFILKYNRLNENESLGSLLYIIDYSNLKAIHTKHTTI